MSINEDIEIPSDIGREVWILWQKNRITCGWFVRPDFTPCSRQDYMMCLRLLQKHGDRATFTAARKLERCLSPNSNDMSAALSPAHA